MCNLFQSRIFYTTSVIRSLKSQSPKHSYFKIGDVRLQGTVEHATTINLYFKNPIT